MNKDVAAFLFRSFQRICPIKLDAFLYQVRLGLESAGGPPGAPDGTVAVGNSSHGEQPGRVEGWHGSVIFRWCVSVHKLLCLEGLAVSVWLLFLCGLWVLLKG